MGSLRLFNFYAIVRNITVSKYGSVGPILRREKHLLLRNALVNETYSKSRKLLADSQGLYRCGVFYRLQHGSPSVSANDISANISSPIPPALSSVNSLNTKETAINNDLQTSPTQIPEVINFNDKQQVTEAAAVVNQLSLPPIPGTEELIFLAKENFHSLGLGGWSVTGIVQELIQFIHVTFDFSWSSSIAIFALTLKILFLPLQIKTKREMNDFNNKLPEFQRLKTKVDEAKMSGNCYEVAAYMQDYYNYAEKNNMGIKKFLTPIINVPVFCFSFFALKKMAETPGLISFQSGGYLWFKDLSTPDQYYILPLILGFTTFFILRNNINPAKTSVFVKLFLNGLPIIVFLLMSRFPVAILCFNVVSNIVALCQNKLLNWDPVRKYFAIPQLIMQEPLPNNKNKSKGIIADIKMALNEYDILKEVNDRERLNAIKFEENSYVPLKRTFKYNPVEARAMLQKKEKK